MKLSSLTSAALAAALIAAASVLAFSALPGLFVWAAFIGWASYDHSGATPQAALRSSAALIFGVVMAWAVAMVVAAGTLPLSTPLVTAITAGIASFLIVPASAGRILSVVPATFYGLASMFAYLSLEPGAFTISAMTSFSWENAIMAVPISLVIGTGLGLTHGWLAYLLPGGGRHTAERFTLTARRSARRGSEAMISASSARQKLSEWTPLVNTPRYGRRSQHRDAAHAWSAR